MILSKSMMMSNLKIFNNLDLKCKFKDLMIKFRLFSTQEMRVMKVKKIYKQSIKVNLNKIKKIF